MGSGEDTGAGGHAGAGVGAEQGCEQGDGGIHQHGGADVGAGGDLPGDSRGVEGSRGGRQLASDTRLPAWRTGPSTPSMAFIRYPSASFLLQSHLTMACLGH